MKLLDSLNRTVKLSLDDGRATSAEEAVRLFESMRIQILVGNNVGSSLVLQAALLTLMNAAPRTFLGGVHVAGHLDFEMKTGWYRGSPARKVAALLSAQPADDVLTLPTILVGSGHAAPRHPFAIYLSCDGDEFVISPDSGYGGACSRSAVGVAAAGAALNECFQHVYFQRAVAGMREVRFRLPGAGSHIRSLCIVGLGHVGQAVAWTAGMEGSRGDLSLTLQDDDVVTESSLSTCLLSQRQDLDHLKTSVVAAQLRAAGIAAEERPHRMDLSEGASVPAECCVVAVDSYSFRRQLDRLSCARVVEAGIGDEGSNFTRMQFHLLPGRRKASDIWCDSDPAASRAVSTSALAYQELLKTTGDACGTTLLAGRSVATPFVGAFVGALAYTLATSDCVGLDAIALDLNALGSS